MKTMTKRDAVRALIRGAMRAYQEQDEACALTLAGAAEGAMPPTTEMSSRDIQKFIHRHGTSMTDREAGDALNKEMIWLKHYNVGEQDPVTIIGTISMLLRAHSRYALVYGFDDLTSEFGEMMGWPPDEPSA